MKLGTDFSGIGAPEMALKYLGIEFESVFACEIDKYARQSFKQLHKTKKFYNDITTRDHKEVEQLDLYIAGFPCQAFSIAGKRKGFEDTRGTLFYNVAEFIKINKPKVFVLENVKGLVSHDSGKTFQTIIDILSNNGGTQNGQISLDMLDDGLGYHIYWQVLNTKNYGIPQNRERIFIVGFKDFKEFNFPKPIELKLTLENMLQDNPNSKYFLSDKMIKFVLNTDFREAKPISKKGISRCLKVGGDVPCFEVKTNTKKIRRLTPLECWRLQGFKDDDFFTIKDISDTQLYKQAGNSITVNVLMALFKKILL
jgi:DNA (cytosine-5)-methyltransferase 1